MSDKLYSSIQIVCALKRIFPELVVQKIRNYAKLAIDLNGYTVEELIDSIRERVKVSEYTYKKYKRYYYNLKRYQVIHVLQKFNIDIPILRYRVNIYYKECNRFHTVYKKVENKLILCEKKNNEETSISILEPIRFIHYINFFGKYIEARYTIQILKWSDKKIHLLIIVISNENAYCAIGKIFHNEMFLIISKYIQGYPISDEILDIRQIFQESKIIKTNELDKSITYIEGVGYTDLYKKDIIYVEIFSLIQRGHKIITDSIQNTGPMQFLEVSDRRTLSRYIFHLRNIFKSKKDLWSRIDNNNFELITKIQNLISKLEIS